jgi:hypothetical protein
MSAVSAMWIPQQSPPQPARSIASIRPSEGSMSDKSLETENFTDFNLAKIQCVRLSFKVLQKLRYFVAVETTPKMPTIIDAACLQRKSTVLFG